MSRLLHIQQQLRRICFWCTTWRCCELLQYLATLANFPGHHKRRNWKEQPWINDVFLVSLCTSQKSQCAYSPILLTWPKVFNTVFNTWHAIRVSLNKLQDHIFSAGSNTNSFFFPFFFKSFHIHCALGWSSDSGSCSFVPLVWFNLQVFVLMRSSFFFFRCPSPWHGPAKRWPALTEHSYYLLAQGHPTIRRVSLSERAASASEG